MDKHDAFGGQKQVERELLNDDKEYTEKKANCTTVLINTRLD
jgi:hypothetical protein